MDAATTTRQTKDRETAQVVRRASRTGSTGIKCKMGQVISGSTQAISPRDRQVTQIRSTDPISDHTPTQRGHCATIPVQFTTGSVSPIPPTPNPTKTDIKQGRYEELKPAQPTGTQGEHKVIQQGTDRSTPSVSRQVWASGRLTLTKVIL